MDLNICFLDGSDTFHSMGISAWSVEKKLMPDKRKIKRPAIVKKNGDVAKIVGIKTYR